MPAKTQKLAQLFRDFFESEQASGLVLLAMTATSILLANSAWKVPYVHFWEITIGHFSILHFINDGLMAIFFLLIGLELKREWKAQDLSDRRSAILPLIAAIGGMLIPVAIYLLFNWGTDTQKGAGIPMATDIAFALGILSLLGKRVPLAAKLFLTALAVIDDLGAILVIAILYAQEIAWIYLAAVAFCCVCLYFIQRRKIDHLGVYLLLGAALWYLFSKAGIHPSIAGVITALFIPTESSSENSSAERLQHQLHRPVAFFILPLFALANTALVFSPELFNSINQLSNWGIFWGLVIGKPLGIIGFSIITIRLSLCSLPKGLHFSHLAGLGFLGGIGFTMSIFISLLAFSDPEQIATAKLAILIASFLSGLLGYFWLNRFASRKT